MIHEPTRTFAQCHSAVADPLPSFFGTPQGRRAGQPGRWTPAAAHALPSVPPGTEVTSAPADETFPGPCGRPTSPR